jgi:hypothetical protein
MHNVYNVYTVYMDAIFLNLFLRKHCRKKVTYLF